VVHLIHLIPNTTWIAGRALHQAIRSKNRRMEALSPEVPRVNLPTVFSANSLMPDAAIHDHGNTSGLRD